MLYGVELKHIKLVIFALLLYQLIMCAVFDHISPVYNCKHIGIPQSGKSVSDGNGRSALLKVEKSLLPKGSEGWGRF